MPGKEVLGVEQPLDRHWPCFSASTSSRASVTDSREHLPTSVRSQVSGGEDTHPD